MIFIHGAFLCIAIEVLEGFAIYEGDMKKKSKIAESVLPNGYRLRRSGKRRTLAMKMQNDGTVIVYAPLYTELARILNFVERNAAWIARTRERVAQYQAAYPPLSDDQIEELRAAAKQYLPARTQYYATIMGLKPKSVCVTSAKTRFGSCSPENGISFSYRLMRYPREAIDYVVVHELAHIREKNHGKRFYELVARYMPDYKERAALLKKQ